MTGTSVGTAERNLEVNGNDARQLVGRTVHARLKTDITSRVLEPGAGSGVMAHDMLAEFARLDALPERY